MSPKVCPICRKPVDEQSRGEPRSPWPFCSERCRLVDLGRWLGERYQIPISEDGETPQGNPVRRPEADRED